MTAGQLRGLLKQTASEWSSHNAPRLGAALSYYMLLSMAPLLIVAVAICGLVFSEAAAQNQLLTEVRGLAGPSGETTVQMLLENARRPESGIWATIIAFGTLLSGASGVFMELRDSLSTIWNAPKRTGLNWKSLLWHRLVSFGMVLALGLLLLVSLVLSAAISIVERYFSNLIPVHLAILSELTNVIFSLAAIAALFALIFKFVPDVPIEWRDVGIGAIFTAILFTMGKSLLALYLSTEGVGSAYGAAGSLLAFVVWVYYSAQIFFFGAIFTHVYAQKLGSKVTLRARPVSGVPAMARRQGA